MNSQAVFVDRGYEVVRELARSDRNIIYLLSKDSNQFAGKLALGTDPVLMQNDVWWSLTLQRLIDENSPLTALPVVEYGEGWLVQPYIDTPVVAERGASPDHLMTKLDAMVRPLVWLDGVLRLDSIKPLYDQTDSAPYHNLLKKVDGWVQPALKSGDVSAEKIQKAKVLVEKYRDKIQPGFQHGDYVPWHMWEIGGKVRLFDAEHASLTKPRYYDLAYLYTRLYTRCRAPEVSRELLKGFIHQANIEPKQFAEAFIPVMTLRALGVLYDAYIDRDVVDYRDLAAEMLERCLANDLSAF